MAALIRSVSAAVRPAGTAGAAGVGARTVDETLGVAGRAAVSRVFIALSSRRLLPYR